MITKEEINQQLEIWATKKVVNGKSINDLFKIEDFPVWWFYKRLMEIKFIPYQLSIEEFTEKKTTLKQKKFILLFKKWIYYSESLKAKLAKNKQREKKDSKKILFLTYTNHFSSQNNNKKYFRLNDLLTKCSGDLEPLVVMVDPFSQHSFSKLKQNITLYDYYTEENQKKAKQIAKSLFQQWQTISEETKKQLFSVELWDKIQPQIDFYFSSEMIELTALYYFTFKRIIEEENVVAVYTSAISSIYEKAVISAASKLKKPSFMGQHGVAIGFSKNETNNLYSANFLVMGQKYKEELISSGILAERIFVTGPLIFNEILPYLEQKKIVSEKKSILFMTSPIVEDNFLTKEDYFNKVKKIISEIKKVTGIELVIKLHPREKNISEYQKAIDGIPEAKVLSESSRDKHFELLSNCDVFLNFGSTTALEAMFLNKPIITIDLFEKGKNPINPFIRESDATLKVDFNEEISKLIQLALNNPKILQAERKKFVEEHCYKLDGKSEERVLEVIKSKI